MSTTSEDNLTEIINQKNGVIEDNIRDEMILYEDSNEWAERGYIIRKSIPVLLAYLLLYALQVISVISLGHL
ncbi:2840_t:CDS:1, partial [Dentiscutata heterogama]